VHLIASSPTSGVTYSWTGPGGFSSTLYNPMVTGPGLYTVVVTNPVNGCTSSAISLVMQNIIQPSAHASGGQLTCATTSVQLAATYNIILVNYSKTGPNGFSSNLQQPTVNAAGTYIVTVTNPSNRCTNVATAMVTSNITAPGAQAAGGQLTCA